MNEKTWRPASQLRTTDRVGRTKGYPITRVRHRGERVHLTLSTEQGVRHVSLWAWQEIRVWESEATI